MALRAPQGGLYVVRANCATIVSANAAALSSSRSIRSVPFNALALARDMPFVEFDSLCGGFGGTTHLAATPKRPQKFISRAQHGFGTPA